MQKVWFYENIDVYENVKKSNRMIAHDVILHVVLRIVKVETRILPVH